MYGHTCWYARQLKTPAAPASAEPMKNVTTITRSTSMPIIAAASRSNAVARIAFPRLRTLDKEGERDHQQDRPDDDDDLRVAHVRMRRAG